MDASGSISSGTAPVEPGPPTVYPAPAAPDAGVVFPHDKE